MSKEITEAMIEAGRRAIPFDSHPSIIANIWNAMERERPSIWSDEEQSAIERLEEELDLSNTQVLRCALRHYQSTHERLKAGETVSWSGDAQRAADFAGPLAGQAARPIPASEADVVERVARAICRSACVGDQSPDDLMGVLYLPSYEKTPPYRWQMHTKQAEAALVAAQARQPVEDAREAKWAKWPEGDAGDALDWALDHSSGRIEAADFLEDWREGMAAQRWPDYMRWLNVQREGARTILKGGQHDR